MTQTEFRNDNTFIKYSILRQNSKWPMPNMADMGKIGYNLTWYVIPDLMRPKEYPIFCDFGAK